MNELNCSQSVSTPVSEELQKEINIKGFVFSSLLFQILGCSKLYSAKIKDIFFVASLQQLLQVQENWEAPDAV